MKKSIKILIFIQIICIKSFAQEKVGFQKIMNNDSVCLEAKIEKLKYDTSKTNLKQKKFLARLEWFANYRMDQSGNLNTHSKKLKEALTNKQRNKHFRSSSTNSYYYIGANGYENAEGNGRIESIWVDPDNYNFVLAGSCTGGLWKKDDAASDWVNITDNSSIHGGVWGIDVQKSYTNIVAIYIIVSQYGNSLLNYGNKSDGIYKSTDGGNTWVDITDLNIIDLENEYLTCIKLDPKDQSGQTLLMTSDKSIYKTVDGGSTWTRELSPQSNIVFSDIDFHPDPNSNQVVVSGTVPVRYDSQNNRIPGLYSMYIFNNSVDGWNPVDIPTVNIQNYLVHRIQAEYIKEAPYELYICYTEADRQPNTNIFISEYTPNAQTLWTPVCNNNNGDFSTITVDGEFLITGNGNIFIGYEELDQFKVVNGYLSNQTNNPPYGDPKLQSHHDIRALTSFSDRTVGFDIIYVATDGGIDRLFLNQYGQYTNIKNISKGLKVGQLYSVANSQNSIDNYYIGLHDNATDIKIENELWDAIKEDDRKDGGTALFDDQNNVLFYIENMSLMKTDFVNTPISFNIFPYWDWNIKRMFKQNPQYPDKFYVARRNPSNGGISEIIESTNAGTTFDPTITPQNAFRHSPYDPNDPEFALHGDIYDLEICESDQEIRYVSSFKYDWSNGTKKGSFFRWEVTQSSFSWINLTSAIELPGESHNIATKLPITDIVIHPDEPETLWVCFGRYENIDATVRRVYCSEDGGITWSNSSSGLPDLPVNVMIYIKDLNFLVCGNDIGVYYKDLNTSANWNIFGSDLPNVIISDLFYNKTSKKLIVATFGRGLWCVDLDCEEMNMPEDPITTATWGSDQTIYDVKVIQATETLTINNGCTIKFAPCAKIIVEPGATLIIDNATLTSFGDRFWDGIIVRGDRNTSQMPGVSGKIIMTNEAVIENARCGVQLADEWAYYGGIIEATNSTFRNCRKSVEFMSYPYNNNSFFKECTFECTGPLSDPMYNGEGINTFVTLWQVDGVEFAGNTFKNTTNYDILGSGERGTAIGSMGAGYDVVRTDDPNNIIQPCDHPDGDPNYFYDLDIGVGSGANTDPTIRVRVMENVFVNCARAIENNDDRYFVAYHNRIWYGCDPVIYPTADDQPAGIKLYNPIGISTSHSEGLFIYENRFKFFGDCPDIVESEYGFVPFDVYIGMFTSSTDNNEDSRIHLNEFFDGINTTNIGNYFAGQNPRLRA
jgi:hypothetical protein